MTIAALIKSLPRDPKVALGEIEGALDPRWVDELSPDARQALVTARAEAMRRAGK